MQFQDESYYRFEELVEQVQELPKEKQHELCLIIRGYIIGSSCKDMTKVS